MHTCMHRTNQDAGVNGTMKHVARVFNDNVGVVRPLQYLG